MDACNTRLESEMHSRQTVQDTTHIYIYSYVELKSVCYFRVLGQRGGKQLTRRKPCKTQSKDQTKDTAGKAASYAAESRNCISS